MTTKMRVLQLLEKNKGELISGGEIADKLSVSRTAVWKQITALQQEGYQITAEQGKGYLLKDSEVLSAYEIERRLQTHTIGHPIYYFPVIDSTNLYAKRTPSLENGAIVVSSQQTGGVGRLSRKFYSPEKMGVYLSIVLHPEKIAFSDVSTITLLTAVAMLDTIEQLTGIRPDIKWTNDIYLHGRKLCGILTEATIEGESGLIRSIIVGIGLNLYQQYADFDPEIQHVAGSIFSETGIRINPSEYVAVLAANFEKYYLDQHFPKNKADFLASYKRALFFLGQTVEVSSVKETYKAVAEDIDSAGELIVRREDGRREALNSGEIRLKLNLSDYQKKA